LKFRQIGDIVLKGKTTPTALFSPISETEDPALVEGYGAAYALLTSDNAGAEAAFRDLANAFPADPIVQFHIGRMDDGIVSARVVMDDK
jgi:TolA-binding protein